MGVKLNEVSRSEHIRETFLPFQSVPTKSSHFTDFCGPLVLQTLFKILYRMYHTLCSLNTFFFSNLSLLKFFLTVLLFYTVFFSDVLINHLVSLCWHAGWHLLVAGGELQYYTDALSQHYQSDHKYYIAKSSEKFSRWWLIREINKIWIYLKMWWQKRTISMLLILKVSLKWER